MRKEIRYTYAERQGMMTERVLLLIPDDERRHYTVIKSFRSSNSKHKCKQHFCMNCLQGFPTEISRDNHFEYCKDNKAVRIEMPKESSLINFHDGQYQFKVPFTMYADFESILKPTEGPVPTQRNRTLKLLISTFPLAFAFIVSLLMKRLKIL